MELDGPAQRERLLRSANPALIVMTVAIGLGGLWAYLVLDWGGYWAWDPVETGSLLPGWHWWCWSTSGADRVVWILPYGPVRPCSQPASRSWPPW